MDWEKIIIGNAAGTARTIEQVRKLCNSAVTRITVGSITMLPRTGNTALSGGNIYYYDNEARTSVNALGIPNVGIEAFAPLLPEQLRLAHAGGKELWVSVAGFHASEFADLAHRCFEEGVDGVELNLGCPNIHDGGESKPIFSYEPALVEEVLLHMEWFAFKHKKIGGKISPVSDATLEVLAPILNASTVLTEVVAVNTLPNQELRRPNRVPALRYTPQGGGVEMTTGGVGGMELHHDSIRVLRKLKELTDLPIISVGGVFSGADIKERLELGAAGVQCATPYYNHENPEFFTSLALELSELLEPA